MKQSERINIVSQLEKLGFIKISDFSMKDYLPYQEFIRHSDLAYSLLYAWEFEFAYRIRLFGENPVIVGFDLDGELFFSVIPYRADTFMESLNEAAELLMKTGTKLMLKYIPEDYAKMLQAVGYETTYSPDYSDYIYRAEDFVCMSGKKNSSKRHEYNHISGGFPDRRYEDITPERYDDVKQIFFDWCREHSCEKCIWGCEREACLRLLELAAQYPERFLAGVVYLDGIPRSFGIAERINRDCVCYHVQKNSISANGLTCYLHHHMARRHLDVPYINWGEDMGIAGLRFNKQKYHPCAMEHKYEIRFQ